MPNRNPRERLLSSQELRDVGLKVTSPRVRILQLLEQSLNAHMTAEEIYKDLVAAGEEIGLATVYRVLSQFEAAGLVTRHNFEEGKSVFERNRGNHHDHMVCMETGKIIEFVNEDIERRQHEVAEAHGYDLDTHSMVLFVRPKQKS
ncbi:MAG: ferric iron uptake transcriptional regulator [Gammaproteobacteria bacterium]|nr:ferric iron uptake transcriptional regulator [Gammaproteobacteria bacterium]